MCGVAPFFYQAKQKIDCPIWLQSILNEILGF